MPDKTKISTTFSGLTTLIEKGQVALQEAIIKIPPKPLFVLFAYGGGGAREMELAADYKKYRLQKKYPNAEIRVISGFKFRSDFKAEWTKLYNELTKPATANKYSLWQIHYFGHGDYQCLGLMNYQYIYFNERDNMERLPWHPEKGIFVLHSCRGGAYEDTCNEMMIEENICLAKTISYQQKTRCLGQVIYASFCVNFMGSIFNTTAEEDAEEFKYRGNRYINYGLSITDSNRALWGYALLTGDTYERMQENEEKYLLIVGKPYSIANYARILGPKKQIMPCRIFNNGELVHNGKVECDYFNKEDLEYI